MKVSSVSKHLVFQLIFKLLTPVSHSYFTSTHKGRDSFWKSNMTTTATSSDPSTIKETIGSEYAFTTDSGNIRERQYTAYDNGTLLSIQNLTSLYTYYAKGETSQSYTSTMMENTTGSQTSAEYEPDVTRKNKSEMDIEQLIQMDTCAHYSTCEHVSKFSYQFCQCDTLCSMYKDCCVDFSNKSTDTVDSIECMPYSSDGRRDGYFAFARCPEDVNIPDEIGKKCRSTDMLTVGPLVLDNDGFVYRNKFCAECHNKTGFRSFSLVISNVPSYYLDKHVHATSFFKLQELLLFTKNNISTTNERPVLELVPPKILEVRRCIQFIPKTNICPNFYTSPIVTSEGIYRNQFCIPTETKDFRCLGHRYHPRDIYMNRVVHGAFPLSVMFSFGNTDIDCKNRVNDICLDQEMYIEYEVKTEFGLISNAILSELQQRQIVMVFLWTIPSDIMIHEFNASPTDIFNSSLSMDFSFKVVIVRPMTGEQMMTLKKTLQNLQCNMVVHSTDAQPIRIHIKKKKINYHNNKTFVKLFNYRLVSDRMLRRENINTSLKKKNELCLKYSINGEFVDNTSLVLREIICRENLFYKGSKTADKIKTILTYTGMSMSVLALIVSLIIHRRLGMHTSIPGSNAENLSFSLLLSNVLFLFGIGAHDYRYVCYIVGVSLHYLWISVFSFMSITIINMLHDLRKMYVSTGVVQQSKTKTALTIIGLFLPAIFVVPGVTLDYLRIKGFNSRYDGKICFPTGYPAAALFVSLPIGLSILVNLTCFIGIAIILTKHSIVLKHIRKSCSYQNVFVYARISAVTGLFWTTGILGMVIPTETVEYLFIICCSLQGFFVALCNLTTKQVIKKLREHVSD